MSASRNTEAVDPRERFVLYRLCDCPTCGGRGQVPRTLDFVERKVREPFKCADCRGEGRIRQEVATCATPEALGVALVTLGREGEWADCPIGVLDRMGEVGQKWLVRPWLPSARNVSDAGRTLARSKTKASG